MLIFRRLVDAVQGWQKIILGRPGWQEHFLRTRRGFIEALIVYALFALIFSLALQSGGMSIVSIVISVAALMLYPLGLAIAVWLTVAFLRNATALGLLVPGTYALVLFIGFGTLAAFLSPVWLALGFLVTAVLMARLAIAAGRLSIITGVAFSALVTVLLVGLPIVLYMLASFDLPPA
jgi:hypothetical protein